MITIEFPIFMGLEPWHSKLRLITFPPRMFLVWNFKVGKYARKAYLNMGWILSAFSFQYTYD